MMKKHKTVLHRLRTYDTKKNPDLNLPPPSPVFIATSLPLDGCT